MRRIENCPSFICDDQGVPYLIFGILSAIILLLPYFIISYQIYKKTKPKLFRKYDTLLFVAIVFFLFPFYNGAFIYLFDCLETPVTEYLALPLFAVGISISFVWPIPFFIILFILLQRFIKRRKQSN